MKHIMLFLWIAIGWILLIISLGFCKFFYDNSFNYNRMGLACAQSWILFLVIALLTGFLFRTSGWVYYGGDAE